MASERVATETVSDREDAFTVAHRALQVAKHARHEAEMAVMRDGSDETYRAFLVAVAAYTKALDRYRTALQLERSDSVPRTQEGRHGRRS